MHKYVEQKAATTNPSDDKMLNPSKNPQATSEMTNVRVTGPSDKMACAMITTATTPENVIGMR